MVLSQELLECLCVVFLLSAPKKSSVKIEKKQTTVVSENMAVPKCLNNVNNDESNSIADK